MLIILALLFNVSAMAANYKPGEIIVKYKEGSSRHRSDMNALYESVGVKTIKHYSGMMKGYEHFVLDQNVSVEAAIAALSIHNDTVEYAQPNYILYALPIAEVNPVRVRVAHPEGLPCLLPGIPFPPGCDDSGGGGDDATEPPSPEKTRPVLRTSPPEVNPPQLDPQMDKAYGLTKVGAVEVWKSYRGDSNFIVADIDTGIDYNHEDLTFNVWRNPHPSDKKDVVGFDFVHNDGLPFDDNQHGTHTAGTIGAVGGNGIGVSGVTQRVSLMALKFLSGEGSGTTADAIRAIDYAIEHGAKVLSNSWGGKGDPDNKALRDAIDRAREKGVLFVAAAGNDGADNDGSEASYPAAFDNDNIISVAATDSGDNLTSFSNFGKKTTHVAAPGAAIYSTVPGNKYASLSGTSMACPHVAGAAALIWSKHPDWDYKRVKAVLLSTVDVLPSLEGKTISGGRINVSKALSVE